ncbi:HNH endonuclease signature motif containing protein [Citricoccus sp. SGAir0253]|uniref:HNH endonuclease n=1 Tax=Citricoccus sp. SGAir0253 TaxID=2567881 RepID=UPI00143D15D9|nr:HNH endonuclease signature motif containing protein [Citricoccus sp. SGAir0253]
MTIQHTPPFDVPEVPHLDRLPLEDLMRLAHEATRSLTRRLASTASLHELSPAPRPEEAAADWGAMLPTDGGKTTAGETHPTPLAATEGAASFTLPVLHHALESVARSIAAAQMSLARHTSEVFEVPATRSRLLGLPEGKTAFRDTADYLRGMLRIDTSEAKRRLRHADVLCASRVLTGEALPPQLPELSAAVHAGTLDRAAIDHVRGTVAEARRIATRAEADPEVVERLITEGEATMVDQGQAMEPAMLRRVCHHWLRWFEAAVDPDGTEPTDLDAPREQGLVYKGRRNGFHHWLLAANDAQHETLRTVAEAANNPRARQGHEEAPEAEEVPPAGGAAGPVDESAGNGPSANGPADTALDPRSRHQRSLDGLIACLSAGLSVADSKALPWTGGTRPQVAVTIDYRTLLGDLVTAGAASAEDLAGFESSATFTGSVHPQLIRTLACDADILPVVLGAEGQVLDVGRAQRLFPARLRQAIAARDGGCAAPGCSIPAPWCDVHHVQYWERGGPTSVDNGVLLCNHHHHAVHAGAWEIEMDSGRPWFIPAPYLDPQQRLRRNRYWRR